MRSLLTELFAGTFGDEREDANDVEQVHGEGEPERRKNVTCVFDDLTAKSGTKSETGIDNAHEVGEDVCSRSTWCHVRDVGLVYGNASAVSTK